MWSFEPFQGRLQMTSDEIERLRQRVKAETRRQDLDPHADKEGQRDCPTERNGTWSKLITKLKELREGDCNIYPIF